MAMVAVSSNSPQQYHRRSAYTDHISMTKYPLRQRSYVLVCAGITIMLLLAHFMSLEDEASTDGGLEAWANEETGDLSVKTATDGGRGSTGLLKITEGAVDMPSSTVGGSELDESSLPYFHCGIMYGGSVGTAAGDTSSKPGNGAEILLLHGAKFTKEDWRTSGILEKLCESPHLSVTALDLSVRADGSRLSDAFHALWSAGVISGSAVILVTPSASGKAMVSLGDMASTTGAEKDGNDAVGSAQDPSELLTRIVKAWIPVASPAVLAASEESIRTYAQKNVPVLAINGSRDSMGKKVTARLVKLVGAKGIELEGGHPCYLDSPDAFVKTVLDFIASL